MELSHEEKALVVAGHHKSLSSKELAEVGKEVMHLFRERNLLVYEAKEVLGIIEDCFDYCTLTPPEK